MKSIMKINSILAVFCLVASFAMGEIATNNFVDWEFDTNGVAGVDSGLTGTDWNTTHPTNATPAFQVLSYHSDTNPVNGFFVNLENIPIGLQFSGDNLNSPDTNHVASLIVLPFGQDVEKGRVATSAISRMGLSFWGGEVHLGNYDGTNFNSLCYFLINGNVNNANNRFISADTVPKATVLGAWNAFYGDIVYTWNGSLVTADITGYAAGDITNNVVFVDHNFLTNLPVNCFALKQYNLYNGTGGAGGPPGPFRQGRVGNLSIDFYEEFSNPYTLWIQSFDVTNSPDMDPDYDADSDGVINLGEYALNGNPTNPADTGIAPAVSTSSSGGTNWFNVINLEVLDNSVSYDWVGKTDLTDPSWVSNVVESAGSGSYSTNYNVVTNRVSTDTESEQFLKLIISR